MAPENLQVLTIGVDLGENDGRLKLRIDANVVEHFRATGPGW